MFSGEQKRMDLTKCQFYLVNKTLTFTLGGSRKVTKKFKLIVCIKKGINKEFSQLMRQYCVLHWGIITKIPNLCRLIFIVPQGTSVQILRKKTQRWFFT